MRTEQEIKDKIYDLNVEARDSGKASELSMTSDEQIKSLANEVKCLKEIILLEWVLGVD